MKSGKDIWWRQTFSPRHEGVDSGKPPRNYLRVLGCLWVLLGCVAIGTSVAATLTTVLLFGVILLMAGAAQLGHALFDRSLDFSWRFLSGILYGIVGLLLIIDPVGGAIGLTFLLALFFLLGGLLRIALAASARRQGRRSANLHLAAGMVNLVLAMLILLSWPAAGTWVLGLFVGIELVLGGFFLIISPEHITVSPRQV